MMMSRISPMIPPPIYIAVLHSRTTELTARFGAWSMPERSAVAENAASSACASGRRCQSTRRRLADMRPSAHDHPTSSRSRSRSIFALVCAHAAAHSRTALSSGVAPPALGVSG